MFSVWICFDDKLFKNNYLFNEKTNILYIYIYTVFLIE